MKNFQPLKSLKQPKLKHKLLFIGSAIAIPALTLISCGTTTTTKPAIQSTLPKKPVEKSTTPTPTPIAALESPKDEVKEGQPQADQPTQQPTIEVKQPEEPKSAPQSSQQPKSTTQVAPQTTSTKFVDTKFPAPVKPAPAPTPKKPLVDNKPKTEYVQPSQPENPISVQQSDPTNPAPKKQPTITKDSVLKKIEQLNQEVKKLDQQIAKATTHEQKEKLLDEKEQKAAQEKVITDNNKWIEENFHQYFNK